MWVELLFFCLSRTKIPALFSSSGDNKGATGCSVRPVFCFVLFPFFDLSDLFDDDGCRASSLSPTCRLWVLNLEIWKYIAVREDERFELKDAILKSVIFNETAFDDRIIE